MRKLLFALSCALAATLALPLAVAQDQTAVPISEAEGGRLWFVELSGAPTADGNTLASVQSEKAAFRKAAAAAGISYTERRAFDVLFNGLSIDISTADRLKLSRLSGVKAMYPVEVIQAPIVENINGGAAPDLATAITMTGADIAQNTLGLTGAGVKVAVMDTGIDIDHPDLGGNGVPGGTPFPSARITHGWDFVGDAYNADPSSPSYDPVPH
ncbi:MAG: peptidase S8, partial [Betaproteobacteria bacterium]